MRKLKLLSLLCLFLCGGATVWGEVNPSTNSLPRMIIDEVGKIADGKIITLNSNNQTGRYLAYNPTSTLMQASEPVAAENENFLFQFTLVENPSTSNQYALKLSNGKYLGASVHENGNGIIVQDGPNYFLIESVKEENVHKGFSIKDVNTLQYVSVKEGWKSSYETDSPTTANSVSAWTAYEVLQDGGYYTMVNGTTATNKPKNLYNDCLYDKNPNNYTLQAASLPESLANNYVWRVHVDGGKIYLTNGQGTQLRASNGTGAELNFAGLHANGYMLFSECLNANNENVGGVEGRTVLTTWGEHNDDTSNSWTFNQVTAYDFYTLVVKGGNENAMLTRNSTQEAAFNGGFFVVAAGEKLEKDDFTATSITGYSSNVEITAPTGGQNGYITVTYSVDPIDDAIYLLRCHLGNRYAFYRDATTLGATGNNPAATECEQGWFFKIGGNATSGYTIRVAKNGQYLYCVDDNAETGVGVKTVDGDPDAACLWSIVPQGTGWNIKPFDGTPNSSWNIRSNEKVAYWTGGHDHEANNTWDIITVQEYIEANTLPESDVVGSLNGHRNAATTAAATLATTFNETNFNTFRTQLLAENILVTPANGWYKIKNKNTSKYLFVDPVLGDKGIAFVNENTGKKHYWYVEFSGATASIKGTTGKPLTRASSNTSYPNATAEEVPSVNLYAVPNGGASWTADWFRFLNEHVGASVYTLDGSDNYIATTNPYILIKYEGNELGNQFMFEPVELANGEQIYTVNIVAGDMEEALVPTLQLTYNDENYTGNKTVYHGGAFVLNNTLATDGTEKAKFTATTVEEMDATVTVEGSVITVTYTPSIPEYVHHLHVTAAEYEDMLTEKEAYINESGRPGTYPTALKNTLANEISLAKAVPSSAQESEVTTRQTALDKAKDDFINGMIVPEAGKTYMFVNARTGNNYAKAMYATEDDLKWKEKNLASNSFYWILSTGEDAGFKVKNGNGTYINSESFCVKVGETNATNTKFEQINESDLWLIKIGSNEPAHPEGHKNAYSVTTESAGNIMGYHYEPEHNASAWRLEPLTGYTVYNVNVVVNNQGTSLPATEAAATYNDDKAIDGGFFVVAEGTTPAAGDVTAVSVEGYKTTVNVGKGTITVTYDIDLDLYAKALNNHIAEAKAILAKTGAGYPTADANAREVFNTAINTAESASKTTVAEVDAAMAALTTAVNTYQADKASIQMPEDGKAYVLVNVFSDTQKKALCYDATWTTTAAYNFTFTVEEANLNYVYICHKMSDGQYVFVNADNNGKYLVHKGLSDNKKVNGNSGFTDEYDSEHSHHSVMTGKRFGCLAIKGHATDRELFFVNNHSGGEVWDQAESQISVDHASCSSDYLFMEYTNTKLRNKIKFTKLNDTDYYVATYSSVHYPTAIPDGVTAYAVTSTSKTEATTWSLQGEGNAIPKNTGVLLAVQANEQPADVYMAPAADEVEKTLPTETNLLEATPYTVSADNNTAFILASVNNVVGFYPANPGTIGSFRAWLDLSGVGGEVRSLSIKFGGDEATGIDGVAQPMNGSGTVYDLSGRAVAKPVKGGFYIKNGVKFIQK